MLNYDTNPQPAGSWRRKPSLLNGIMAVIGLVVTNYILYVVLVALYEIHVTNLAAWPAILIVVLGLLGIIVFLAYEAVYTLLFYVKR